MTVFDTYESHYIHFMDAQLDLPFQLANHELQFSILRLGNQSKQPKEWRWKKKNARRQTMSSTMMANKCKRIKTCIRISVFVFLFWLCHFKLLRAQNINKGSKLFYIEKFLFTKWNYIRMMFIRLVKYWFSIVIFRGNADFFFVFPKFVTIRNCWQCLR